jgi:hypothetical protein
MTRLGRHRGPTNDRPINEANRLDNPHAAAGLRRHKNLYVKGVRMDPNMNKYNLEHVCTSHPLMSADDWRGVYRDAWARYYTDAHVETVLRRAVASGLSPRKIVDAMTVFSGSTRIEGVHPLQFGYVRRKLRTQRRDGMATSIRSSSILARLRFPQGRRPMVQPCAGAIGRS